METSLDSNWDGKVKIGSADLVPGRAFKLVVVVVEERTNQGLTSSGKKQKNKIKIGKILSNSYTENCKFEKLKIKKSKNNSLEISKIKIKGHKKLILKANP